MADVNEKAETKAADASPSEGKAGSETAKSAKKKKEPMSVSRRTLVIGAGSTAALLGLGALRYVGHTPLNRPPGGQSEAHLVNACIRCEKCYESCPRKVIYPAKIEDGLLGMRSPALNFNSNYCDFCVEENNGVPLCVKSCPTEALALPTSNATLNSVSAIDANNARIGLAKIDTKTCLAYRDTGCHFCYDACAKAGYNAIELDGSGYSPHPRVVENKCVGCGACESVCTSLQQGSIVAGATERAITVRPAGSI